MDYTVIWARRTARFTVEVRRHESNEDPANELPEEGLRAIRRGESDWFDVEVAVLSIPT